MAGSWYREVVEGTTKVKEFRKIHQFHCGLGSMFVEKKTFECFVIEMEVCAKPRDCSYIKMILGISSRTVIYYVLNLTLICILNLSTHLNTVLHIYI